MLFFLSTLFVIACLLYLYGTRNFNYWKKKGVIYEKPYPFFGNTFKQLIFKISISDFFTELYNKYPNERFVGLYNGNKITLLIRDPKDVQHVLISGFNAFHSRGLRLHKLDSDPFLDNLFTAEGDLWRLLRQRMTPAFTTGKLKAMFPIIIERAEKLQILAAEAAHTRTEVDMKDLIARYTTDFIGACGFGIDAESLEDENSKFRKLGHRIINMQAKDIVRMLLKVLMPYLFKDLDSVPSEVKQLTIKLVKDIMEQRNYEPSERNDFIDLLLEIKKKGKMVGESIEKRNDNGTPMIVARELDDLLIAAQVFIFFAAGFETSSSTSSFTLHQLAFHPEAQKKCQDEIDTVLKQYDGKLCFDAIKEMKYLAMAFKESMRLFPSLGVLNRESTSKYTFPDSDLTIDPEVAIFIPVHAMQMDKKYFEEPEKFIPERFSPENIHKIQNHVYLPFGEGPRACIGERLGFMQALAGLAAILSKFTVVPSKNTKRYPITNPLSVLAQTTIGGYLVLLESRKKVN